MTNIMESVINSSTGTARNRISVKDKNGEVMPVAGKTGTSNYYEIPGLSVIRPTLWEQPGMVLI